MPETLTGTLESLAVPSPSCPSLLAPQHDMLPSVCTAQTWSRPAAMRRTPLRSGTCCGTLTLSSGSPPSPSVPKAFSPQHQGTSPSVTAQVNADPTAKDVTVPRPWTSFGRKTESFAPSPSCPAVLDPQQCRVPTERRAHVWEAPPETATAPVRLATLRGVFELWLLPVPSWP